MSSEQQIDSEYLPSVSVKVHSSGGKEKGPGKKPKTPQILRDYQTYIARIANNDKLTVQDRISKLTDFGKKTADGWPFKNNPVLMDIRIDGVPTLSRQAHAAADQLLSIEKVKAGGSKYDTGKMGNQE